ncbi:hypothetical protein BCIN_10g00180 [Botrytis cinerea B05.10]|uniref:Uncharacterized protein n=1 Tax=Botryotinia fuckeliana (strain B05.10) TaxID=332648 RepID=A0A384JTU0_BOTFB|nr:hypothetical protein BCIN_10g00180 [Botrytis cinerea B05.10]ATZ53989.1 hypothetical protein BCIN_10g00180 [Botrytis cinerea B05.10]
MNPYAPTAEVPILNPRRRRMLHALFDGSRQDFMMNLYKIAEEDLAVPQGNQRYSKRGFLTTMIEDRDSGELDMLKLLLTMSTDVLESLILNTIGSKFQLDPEFRKHFSKMENSGIYLNTVMSGAVPGKGLNGREWAVVTAMMSRYIRSRGVIITNNSTAAQRDDADEASSIDNAFGSRPPLDIRNNESYRGHRNWLNSGQTTETFRRNLTQRSNLALDPTQRVRQTQSPIEVGLSHDMATRIKCHHPESGLRNTVKTWGLFLSCLSVAEMEFTVVSIPVLKVWNRSLIGKAEILITFLAGSSFDEGGFNAAPPGGTKSLSVPESLPNNKQEIFTENDTFSENLKVGEEDLSEKQKSLSILKDFDFDLMQTELDESKAKFEETRAARYQQKRDIRKATGKIEELGVAGMAMITEASSRIERRNQFGDKLNDWLNKTTPAD